MATTTASITQTQNPFLKGIGIAGLAVALCGLIALIAGVTSAWIAVPGLSLSLIGLLSDRRMLAGIGCFLGVATVAGPWLLPPNYLDSGPSRISASAPADALVDIAIRPSQATPSWPTGQATFTELATPPLASLVTEAPAKAAPPSPANSATETSRDESAIPKETFGFKGFRVDMSPEEARAAMLKHGATPTIWFDVTALTRWTPDAPFKEKKFLVTQQEIDSAKNDPEFRDITIHYIKQVRDDKFGISIVFDDAQRAQVITLSTAAVNAIFNSEDMSAEDFCENFVNAYPLSSPLKHETVQVEDKEVAKFFGIPALADVMESYWIHTDSEGWTLQISDDEVVLATRSKLVEVGTKKYARPKSIKLSKSIRAADRRFGD